MSTSAASPPDDHQETLTKFKALLLTPPPPSSTATPESSPQLQKYDPTTHPDDLLLRFLKARKYDLEKSHLMFTNYLSWRKSYGVDEIVANLRYPEYAQVMEIYPRFYHKTDKLGRPVYFEVMSNLNSKLLDGSITTADRFVQYYVREYEKTVRYRFAAVSAKAGRVIDKSCTIMDLKNVPLMQCMLSARCSAKVTHIAQNYYPETLGRMFIINAPLLFQGVWTAVKGMLDEATVAKISILGANYKAALLDAVDAANLPAEYGGACTCGGAGCRAADPWPLERRQCGGLSGPLLGRHQYCHHVRESNLKTKCVVENKNYCSFFNFYMHILPPPHKKE
ncbi:CRAL-TRIO domain-containing protein [Obelidium mucronatum]|nr:CRAL-TRIO domain-containing protein [Obelidium mucronatum]